MTRGICGTRHPLKTPSLVRCAAVNIFDITPTAKCCQNGATNQNKNNVPPDATTMKLQRIARPT